MARVRRHRGKAEASAGRFAWIRPEVAATIARLRWARGRRRGALRGFARALAEAERLGMRPEAARIRADVAVRLLAAGAHAPTFDGHTGPALLATARQALTALDLGWDLGRLDDALGSAVQGAALAAALR